jgi:hypothetical protein
MRALPDPVRRRQLALVAASLAIVVPVGFLTRREYHDTVGGTLYEVFWCLLASAALPQVRPRTIALAVLACTCLLEFGQLWHPPFLEWARSFFIGRTILGTSFDWFDFPYYFLGSALGWAWLTVVARACRAKARAAQA